MIKISDAELMAYADGVLPRHLRPLVRQALLREPELLQKLESYIITNRGLAAPFAQLPPLPDRVRQMLAGGDAAPRRGGLWSLLPGGIEAPQALSTAHCATVTEAGTVHFLREATAASATSAGTWP